MPRHLVALTDLLAAAVLAGCSAAPTVFDAEGGLPATCLVHQTGEPGPAYVDPDERDSGAVLALTRYYTAHGTLPFCDGAAPTDSDRARAQVYLDLGGAADKVHSVQG